MIYFWILNFLVVFSVLISTYLGTAFPLYYVFSIMLLIYYLFNYKSKKVIRNREILSLILYLVVFAFLLLLEAIFGVLPDLLVSLKSVLSLTWIPIFLVIFFSRVENFDLKKFIRFHIYMGVVVSILGILQYFFSRDLWGYIPRIRLDSFYDNLDVSYRASSVLYSEQVYGLFCLLNAIVILEFKDFFKRHTSIIFLLIFIISGLLSGNKSVTFLIAIYFFLKVILFNNKNRFLILAQTFMFVLAIILFLSYTNNDAIIRSFTWFFEKGDVSSADSNKGRYLIYSSIIESTNVLIGNKVGSTMSSNNENYINTESYFLQLYSEGGAILLLLFLNFASRFLIYYYKVKNTKTFNLFTIILCSMVFVHAFGSPVFIGFWVIIVAPLFFPNSIMQNK